MKLGSRELIRDINSKLVLETIINKQPISRAAISKELGLTKATVSAIVQDLLDQNLVLEIGSDDTSLGRKPILLGFHKKCGYAISVEVGTSVTSAMCSDLLCGSRVCRQIATPPSDRLRERICALIRSVCPEAMTPYGLVGICLAIHGITKHNEIIFTPYYEIADLPLGTWIAEEFDVPVFVHNEANLSAIGEYAVLPGNHKNIANLSIHAGVGMGLILNRKLYSGHTGRAGEFGHTVIVRGGRRCPCGNRGCLEQYVSERAVLAEYANALSASALSSGTDTDALALSAPSFADFARAVHAGMPAAVRVFDEFIQNLAIGISNILNCFDPEVLFLNSSFTTAFPDVCERVLAALPGSARRDLTLQPARLGDYAALTGGINVVVRSFLGIEQLPFASNSPDTQN
ncbi:MAG: ROK family transcriptional regulator [Lachnospiraceae bacterium]|nr:ROK family transcriptional regulator [Lachnospiraceae bacterium]